MEAENCWQLLLESSSIKGVWCWLCCGSCCLICWSFAQNKKYSVFAGFITQLCSVWSVCVERGHMFCAYIKLHFPSSLVWLFCHKTYLLPSPDPILVWLVWTNSPVFTPQGYGPVSTTVQIMSELHSIMDTRQVREYPVEIEGEFHNRKTTQECSEDNLNSSAECGEDGK